MQHNVLSRLAATLLALAMALGMTLPACADVLVFGGTRGIGLEVVRQLREQGEGVTVLVRETSDLTALNAIDGVATTIGDAMDREAVTRAFAAGEFDTVMQYQCHRRRASGGRQSIYPGDVDRRRRQSGRSAGRDAESAGHGHRRKRKSRTPPDRRAQRQTAE
jgi:NAD(P)-dependent dehydrogenase (short-subunit alcohol dehydrogenase family)